MVPTRDITTCVQQLKLSLSVENYYPNTRLQSMTSVWNSRNDQREEKKRKIEKKETRRRTRSNQFACFG